MNLLRTLLCGLLLLEVLGAGAQTVPDVAVPVPAKAKVKVAKTVKPAATGPAYNTNLVVIDPAHGGADNGAVLGEGSFEKAATVALAGRLRARLVAQGFTVVLTHEGAGDDVTADQRIEQANKGHAVACLVLHASNGGHGVHVYTSALTPVQATGAGGGEGAIAAWDTAQRAVLPQSLRLANDVAQALNAMRIPLVVGQASIRPIDSLTCPAVLVELAPLNSNGDVQTPATDGGYQDRIAASLTTALTFWRGHAVSAAMAQQGASAAPAAADAAKPAAKPKAKVKPTLDVPEEVQPADGPVKPRVPIVRRPVPPPVPNPNGGGAR